MDVDLALAITAENLSRAVDAFEELGLVPVALERVRALGADES